MSIFASVATMLLALAVLCAAILYTRIALAWRIGQDEGRLRLVQVLARHGAPDQALGAAAFGAAVAMRRCMMCPHKTACDRWLSSGAPGSIGAFCPNAEFVEQAAGAR